MFSFFKKRTLPTKKLYGLDHSTDRMEQLKILTERMDRIDRRRKIHEKFVDMVIASIDPILLEKDEDDIYLFLTNEKIAEILKEILDRILKKK